MNQTFDIYVIWDVKCSLDFNLNVYFLKCVKKMPEITGITVIGHYVHLVNLIHV